MTYKQNEELVEEVRRRLCAHCGNRDDDGCDWCVSCALLYDDLADEKMYDRDNDE